MIVTLTRQVVIGTALFLLCEFALLFLRILPLSGGFSTFPGPDAGLCLILAWVLRQPGQLPALAIVLVTLLGDILLLRPLGLWTVIVLLGSEAARLREARWRDQSFMVEWLRVAMMIGAMMLANRVMLFLFLSPVPGLGQAILQYLATAACYPLVVFAARWLVGLRRITPVEAEMMRYGR